MNPHLFASAGASSAAHVGTGLAGLILALVFGFGVFGMAAPVPAPIRRDQSVGSDVITQLTLFQEAFLNAFRGYAAPMMVGLGIEDSTTALAYKMPMSVGSSAWAQITGGVAYDNLGEIMLPVTIVPYAAAVAAEVKKLQSDQWTGWGERPGEMAFNARNIGEAALAAALEAGGTTLSAENFLDQGPAAGNALAIKVFQNAHPYSPLDLSDSSSTWSNDYTSTTNVDSLGNDYSAAPLNLASIDRVSNNSHHMIGMNGKDFYAAEWWAVVVPPALERQARRYFDDQGGRNDMVTEGLSNVAVTGKPDQFQRPNTAKDLKVEVVVNRYLTNTTTWYPVFRTPASRKAPWVVINQVPAHAVPFSGGSGGGLQQVNIDEMGIEWIIDDLSSTAYKHGVKGIPKGHVGIQGIRSVGAGITVSRQIARCQAT